jgi:hypothetical protein
MFGLGVGASVTVVENGREGRVIYNEGLRSIAGYWEFGGGDVVAIVSMGNEREWGAQHAWALEQRGSILRFVADELIRQKAPRCRARIDETRGDIELLPS